MKPFVRGPAVLVFQELLFLRTWNFQRKCDSVKQSSLLFCLYVWNQLSLFHTLITLVSSNINNNDN